MHGAAAWPIERRTAYSSFVVQWERYNLANNLSLKKKK
jgi:hypothetical protein